MKTIKDEFDIIKQPKHLILSILLVRGVFPLSKETHESLERLGKVSDILLVFDEETFKETKRINKSKFASLYESCSWVVSNTGFNNSIINAFVYAGEIFGRCHTSFLVGNLDELNVSDRVIQKIREVNTSSLIGPVLKIDRLSSEDFYKTYVKEERISLSYGHTFLKIKNENEETNKFSSYTSTSQLVFMRPISTVDIINFWKTDEGRGYVNTFENRDCRFMLASMIKHLGLQYINESIEYVKV